MTFWHYATIGLATVLLALVGWIAFDAWQSYQIEELLNRVAQAREAELFDDDHRRYPED